MSGLSQEDFSEVIRFILKKKPPKTGGFFYNNKL